MADKEDQNSKKPPSKSVSVVNKTSSVSEDTPKTVPNKGQCSTSTKEPELTREVLSILQELNENVKSQKERIEKLESAQYYDEEYSEDQFYDDDGQSFDEIDQENVSPNPVFRNLMERFSNSDPVDKKVNDDLAKFVNSSFRNELSDDKMNELLKEVHRPENCEALVKTRVNQGIWRLLRAQVQYDDNKMQSVQELLVKAASNITKSVDILANSTENPSVACSKAIDLSTNAIALLGQTYRNINIRRKELHKSSLDPKYHYLASPSLPCTDFLYGDDNDVNRNVREINDLNKIGHIG